MRTSSRHNNGILHDIMYHSQDRLRTGLILEVSTNRLLPHSKFVQSLAPCRPRVLPLLCSCSRNSNNSMKNAGCLLTRWCVKRSRERPLCVLRHGAHRWCLRWLARRSEKFSHCDCRVIGWRRFFEETRRN
jgi:hypothetical protein